MTDIDENITPEFIHQEVARAKTYTLVLLNRGPRERDDQELLDDLQLKHLRHMFALRRKGKLVLNGPSLVDSELRGICIYNVTDLKEVKACVNNDPLVRAGFLVAEILPWMGMPGDKLP